jgi:NAD-dependent SIR2 family protein deacetylase
MSNLLRLWGCYACRKIFPEHRAAGLAGRSKLPLCPKCNSSAVTRQLDWLLDRKDDDGAGKRSSPRVVSLHSKRSVPADQA